MKHQERKGIKQGTTTEHGTEKRLKQIRVVLRIYLFSST